MKTIYNPAPSTQERKNLAISSRHKNPVGDRPLEFVSQELFQCWEIALSSFYQAISKEISKLNNKSILLNPSGLMLIDWRISSFSHLSSDFSKNAKSLILGRQTCESVIFSTLSDESRGGERIEMYVF
jgi:hypothetical protein